MNYVQRKKGWRMPPNTLYCGRPGKYGNRFSVSYDEWWVVWDVIEVGNSLLAEHIKHNDAIRDMLSRYQDWFMERHGEAGLMELAQYDALSDWCEVGEPCHVQNVLIPLVEAWKESRQ